MPPADDPLARLHARSAIVKFLNKNWREKTPDGPAMEASVGPILGGFEIDLYMLFEGVRALGGIQKAMSDKLLPSLKYCLNISEQCNSYGSQFRARYISLLKPWEDQLATIVEKVYAKLDMQDNSLAFLLNRGVWIPGVSPAKTGRSNIRDHMNLMHNKKAVAETSESALACIRADMEPFRLEENEMHHEFFCNVRPCMAQLDVRVHIVRLWYRNVCQRLDVTTALQHVPSRYRSLGLRVFTYLEAYGKINFGLVLPDLSHAQYILNAKNEMPSVSIIGAGVAGLAAATQLRRFGISVIVYESRKRCGGRAFTDKQTFGVPVDLGACVFYEGYRSPMYTLAQQARIPLRTVPKSLYLFNEDSTVVDEQTLQKAVVEFQNALDSVWEECFFSRTPSDIMTFSLGDALRRIIERRAQRQAAARFRSILRKAKREERDGRVALAYSEDICARNERLLCSQIFRWLVANLEMQHASDLADTSLSLWKKCRRIPALSTTDMDVPCGTATLVDVLTSSLDGFIHCNEEVVHINVAPNKENCERSVGLKFLHDSDHEPCFSAVVVAVPLGVLQKGGLEFSPELPETKLKALDRMGVGIAIKVLIQFESAFWLPNAEMFGCLGSEADERGAFTCFRSLLGNTGSPILESTCCEPSIGKITKFRNDEIIQYAMSRLRQCHPTAPDPINFLVTRWDRDVFSKGVASHVRAGWTDSEFDMISQQVGDHLFFAGEHTYKNDPSCISGAFWSGCREAGNVLTSFGFLEYLHAANKDALAPILSVTPQEDEEDGVLVDIVWRAA